MKMIVTFFAGVGLAVGWSHLNQESIPVTGYQVAAASELTNQQAEDQSPLSVFMHRKLSASNLILRGLVTDDLELAQDGARELLKMSHAEKWRASSDMMYLNHSREFQRSVETLQKKAKSKSIDGTALAWVDVTMNCIQCHEWVRDVMLTQNLDRN